MPQDPEYGRNWRKQNADRTKLYRQKWNRENRAYKAAYNRKWREANKDRAKAQRLSERLSRYGLTVTAYNAIIKQQNNSCAACQHDFALLKTHNIHIDHCHKTNIVRGMLCGSCNRALGIMKDNPDKIRMLAEYIARAPTSLSSSLLERREK